MALIHITMYKKYWYLKRIRSLLSQYFHSRYRPYHKQHLHLINIKENELCILELKYLTKNQLDHSNSTVDSLYIHSCLQKIICVISIASTVGIEWSVVIVICRHRRMFGKQWELFIFFPSFVAAVPMISGHSIYHNVC